MPARLLVDLSVLGRRPTGVSVYAINLAKYLQEHIECEVICPDYLASHFDNALICPPPLLLRNSLLGRRRSPAVACSLRGAQNALIYCPHMHGRIGHGNQVITIHDMIARSYPGWNLVDRGFNELLLPGIVRGARAVFTVSETSRQALCSFYKLDPAKVSIIPNGIDLATWRPGISGTRDGGYLLTVSANRPYKNTIELLEHHALWSSKYRLKIVSSKARYGVKIRAAVVALKLEDSVDFLDDLREDELIELYRSCAALVYPSLMEGFGRPALEAMAVRRPVILSDIKVHRENFGDAAIYITPGNTRTWRAAFNALGDRWLVEDKLEQGLRLAAGYSWERAGQALVTALSALEPELAVRHGIESETVHNALHIDRDREHKVGVTRGGRHQA